MTIQSISHAEASRRCDAVKSAGAPVSRETVEAAVQLLQHPDPTIRDDLAYVTVRDAVLAGTLDDHAQWLVEHFTGPEGMRYDPPENRSVPAGVVRSFAVLGLVLVVHRARRHSAVSIDLESVLQTTTALLDGDQDLTSWDPRYGWVHLVAHAADLVDELFEVGLEAPSADALTRGLVGLVLRKSDCLFAFGEYERVAFALATGLMGGVLSLDAVAATLNAEEAAAAEFADLPGSAVRTNHVRALARALYWQLVARDADAAIVEGVRRVNLALIR